MSLGQLALHVATIPGGISQIMSNDKFDVPEFQQPSAKSAGELIPALDESVRTAKVTIGGWDDQKVMGTWQLIKDGKVLMAAPRVALLRSFMLNHWYHHRGQLSVYLRLLEIPVPSIYGPSADENPWN
jgi:uncharacterized damage-inducible protein DinB